MYCVVILSRLKIDPMAGQACPKAIASVDMVRNRRIVCPEAIQLIQQKVLAPCYSNKTPWEAIMGHGDCRHRAAGKPTQSPFSN